MNVKKCYELLNQSFFAEIDILQASNGYRGNFFFIDNDSIRFTSNSELNKGIAFLRINHNSNGKLGVKINSIFAVAENNYIYEGKLSYQKSLLDKVKAFEENMLDGIIFETLLRAVLKVFAKFMKKDVQAISTKSLKRVNKEILRIERAFAINISGGINGCCIIDFGERIAKVLTKVMGTYKFRVSEEEKLKMTMQEFSNIIIGNMGILLSNEYGIDIDLSPPLYLADRYISRINARLQTISIPLVLYGKVEKYNISILRRSEEYSNNWNKK